jgi:hypothetical protein
MQNAVVTQSTSQSRSHKRQVTETQLLDAKKSTAMMVNIVRGTTSMEPLHHILQNNCPRPCQPYVLSPTLL